MGIYGIKPRFQRVLQPLVTWLVSWGIQPDALTYSALIISILAGALLFYAERSPWLLWLVPPLALLRLTLNALDGLVARRTGLAGPWGEVKNELADRVADIAVFLGIGLGGYASPFLALPTLALVLLVPYAGVLAKAVGGSRVYGGIMGKPDRMIALSIFVLYPLLTGNLASFDFYLAFVAATSLITLVQRLRTIHGSVESPD